MAYGTVNTDIVSDSSGGKLAPISSVFRNRIINGAMVIDQRNAGASVTPTTGGTYTLDRWQFSLTQSSKFSTQQNAGSVTPPAGFSNYLGVTSLSAYSVQSSDFTSLNQAIEGFNTADLGWGTANAKTVTLSFQVYSSLTGTFGGAITNGANSYSYPFAFTISSANTWTSISITIAGPTAGTWIGATNGIGMYLRINLGSGSTYQGTAGAWVSGGLITSSTGAVNLIATNGATFYITGVQLEVGSSATGYEYRQYGQELALCQRYYYQATGTSGAAGYWMLGAGTVTGSTGVDMSCPVPVPMRVTPSVNYSGTLTIQQGLTSKSVTSISAVYGGTSNIYLSFGASAGGLTVNYAAVIFTVNASTNYVTFSSEL